MSITLWGRIGHRDGWVTISEERFDAIEEAEDGDTLIHATVGIVNEQFVLSEQRVETFRIE